MSIFESQIRQREELDQQLLEDSFIQAAGVVLGRKGTANMEDERFVARQAMDDILKYYHLKPADIPSDIKDLDEQMDFCLRPHGILSREIKLEEGWYKDAYGPMLGFEKETGMPTALIPGKMYGYCCLDRKSGSMVRINKDRAAHFDTDAYCFYKPLPQRKLSAADLIKYMMECVNAKDWMFVAISVLAVTLTGMVVPRLTKALTGPAISGGSMRMLTGIAVCMLFTSIATQMFTSVNQLLSSRLTTKTSMGVESAMMMRLLSLPPIFFRQYSSGELSSRSQSVNQLCSLIIGIFVGTGLTSISSLLYITQICSFASALVVPSLIIILVTVAVTLVSSFAQIRISGKLMEQNAKESGMSHAVISGIQKIKLAGAEKRFFARWLMIYSKGAELTYAPPMFLRINSVITLAISLFSTIILYYTAIKSGISQSDYYAFTASYGMVMGAFTALAGVALQIGRIKPVLDMAEPFLKAEPETNEKREIVTKLSGAVELSNVSFRYNDNTPYIVNNLSLKIKPGEYVAIVGKTGCGKSTLIRLLLGFERPEKGAVFYDGRDVNSLDPESLRNRIGAVMQDDGLFQGDIYSNIVISAPQLTLSDAWEAAETAGIADDIRNMPMGMNTIISEGQGGISGGQKQRIMIARAIAPKPKILIFDEATSALDNKTQRQVSDALDSMGCTRIVIAHRLSTIRHCNRILVLDGGKIIEEGTYDELIERNGSFAELVSRQRIDGRLQH